MNDTLAVFPIFINAGAAILPAIVAAVGSVLAVLLHPRELLRFSRRRPVVVASVVLGIGGSVAAAVFIAQIPPPARTPRSDDEIDWTRVAMRIINRERIAAGGGAVNGGARTRPAGAFIYRSGPSRRGYDGGPVPVKLVPDWPPYKQPDTMYLSSPAVVGKRLFGASCMADPTGYYGEVFCLDATSGRKLWSSDSVGDDAFKAFFSSPAVTADGKYLVIGQGLHDHDGCSLLCFRTDTGKLHWQIKTPLHIEGSPAVRDGMAIAGAGAIEGPDGSPTGDPGFVIAVRISDGRQLWRYPVKDPESSPVIADDGVCYIGSGVGGNELVALRTETDDDLKATGRKRVLWRAPTPYPATGAVTLRGNLVIIGCGKGNYVEAAAKPAGAVIAFNRHSGAKVWHEPMPAAVLGAVAVGGNMAICPVRNGEVIALRLTDGKKMWRQRVNGTEPVLASPVLAGHVVYAVSRDGYLAVIDARPGLGEGKRVIEKHYLNDQADPGAGRSVSSPLVSGARVYVGSETGGMRCFAGMGQAK